MENWKMVMEIGGWKMDVWILENGYGEWKIENRRTETGK